MAPGKRVLEDLGLTVTSPGSKARKHSAVQQHPQQDPTKEGASRDAVIDLLYKALHSSHEPGSGSSGGGADDDKTMPTQIEEALHQKFAAQGGRAGKAYKAAVRNLTANLKRNADLASRVLHGEVQPSELVNMDAFQLATSEQKEQLAKSHIKLLREATLHDSSALTTTDEYTCPACQSTACSYLDLDRRDIGKSETWGGKQHEGKDRSVTCLTCGHKWGENFM